MFTNATKNEELKFTGPACWKKNLAANQKLSAAKGCYKSMENGTRIISMIIMTTSHICDPSKMTQVFINNCKSF